VKVVGYGANDDSLLPSFSPTWISFVTLYGGIVAFPNIRGGSEFGKDWANAGQKSHVMNGVRDFVSATCAEFQFSRGMNFRQNVPVNTLQRKSTLPVTKRVLSARALVEYWSFAALPPPPLAHSKLQYRRKVPMTLFACVFCHPNYVCIMLICSGSIPYSILAFIG